MIHTQVALCEVRGPLNQLNDSLSGEDAHLWQWALKKMLRGEDPWKDILQKSPVWADIELGLHKTPAAYRDALVAAGWDLSVADDVFEHSANFPCSSRRRHVSLVKFSCSWLGIRDSVRKATVYRAAERLGLKLCPAEAVLAVALECKPEIDYPHLEFATEPLVWGGRWSKPSNPTLINSEGPHRDGSRMRRMQTSTDYCRPNEHLIWLRR